MAETNPYLALLQERPRGNPWDLLSNALLGVGSGISQASSSGQGWGSGIAPGLMLGNQMTAQAEHQAEQERIRRLQIGIQASEWDEKRKLREQQAAAMARMGQNLIGSGAPTTGITSPQPPPYQMGPGGNYEARLTGQEGGTRNGGMIFNELGSGAGGPYQIMPATWADIRAKNPDLNLPEVMPVDNRPETRALHDAAHARFKAGNAQALQAAGFQPTPENLYLAHRFGAGGAVTLLRADPNKPLHEVLPIDWQRQNPDMRGQTVGGFQRLAQQRMGGVADVPYQVPPDAKPTPYALMPDDVPFNLPGGGTTLPRPSAAEPTFTVPVMPQPQWPTLAQPPQPPQQQPPQQQPQPPQVPQGDPNIVRTGGIQPPGSVVRVSEGPPIVPPPRPQDLPPALRQQLAQLLQTPGVTPEEYLKAQQQVMQHYHQQLQTQATEGWREQKAAQLHAQGRSEKQIDDEIRKIEEEKKHERSRAEEQAKHERDIALEQKPMLDSQTSQIINVPKPQWGDRRYVPLDAQKEAREAERLALEKQKAAQDAANAKVNPVTMQPNQPLIQAETQQAAAITAAQEAAKLDTTAASALVTQAVKDFSDKERPKGLAIQETIPNIHNVRRLVEAGAITGTGTETRNYLAQLASTLGFKSNEAALTPAYLGAMADQIVANAKALGVNPTNRDNEIIAKAKGADPNVSKEGLLQLLDVQEQLQRRAHQRYIAEAKRIQSMRGVKQAYGEDYFMLPEPPTYPEYLKENPLPGQPVPGQPSSVGKSPWERERERRGKMNSATPGG